MGPVNARALGFKGLIISYYCLEIQEPALPLSHPKH